MFTNKKFFLQLFLFRTLNFSHSWVVWRFIVIWINEANKLVLLCINKYFRATQITRKYSRILSQTLVWQCKEIFLISHRLYWWWSRQTGCVCAFYLNKSLKIIFFIIWRQFQSTMHARNIRRWLSSNTDNQILIFINLQEQCPTDDEGSCGIIFTWKCVWNFMNKYRGRKIDYHSM